MDEEALRRAIDAQSVAFLRLAATQSWAEIIDEPDVIHGFSGIPLAPFNGAAGARFEPGTADRRIEDVLRPFRDRKVDMTWRVGTDPRPTDLIERLVAHGLHPEEPFPIMGRSLSGWAPEIPPPGVDVQRVADREAFQTATRIMATTFEFPVDMLDAFMTRYEPLCIGPGARQTIFLATLDGTPAATSLAFVDDGVVGIYNVATLAQFRRRGLGRAATIAAMGEGSRLGAGGAVLVSSPMGHAVYEALGFAEIGIATVLLGAYGSAA